MDSENSSPLPIKVIADKFYQVPRFWLNLMGDYFWCDAITGKQVDRIPASFWKYTLFLWCKIVNGNKDREAKLSLRDFPMQNSVSRWTAAYSVSGLFKVTYGRRTNTGNKPTVFQYNRDADEADWRCFMEGLNHALLELKNYQRGNKNADTNTGGFRVLVALGVDGQRTYAGLPTINSEFLDNAAEGFHRDDLGRPIARRVGNTIEPIFYDPTKLERLEDASD